MRRERVDRMVRAYGLDFAKWPEPAEVGDWRVVSPRLARSAAELDAALAALGPAQVVVGPLPDAALAEAAIGRSVARRMARWTRRVAAASVLLAAVIGAAAGIRAAPPPPDGLLSSADPGLWVVPGRPSKGTAP
jgi:hypothetical protein